MAIDATLPLGRARAAHAGSGAAVLGAAVLGAALHVLHHGPADHEANHR